MSECLVFSLRKKTLRENTRPYRYHGLKIFTSLRLRFQDFQRMMGFKAFHSAQATIAGIETAHMIRKGQLSARTIFLLISSLWL
jgi:transposase-like protein